MQFNVEVDVLTRAAMSRWVAGFSPVTRDLTFRTTSRVRRGVVVLLFVQLLQNFEIFFCSSTLYRNRKPFFFIMAV